MKPARPPPQASAGNHFQRQLETTQCPWMINSVISSLGVHEGEEMVQSCSGESMRGSRRTTQSLMEKVNHWKIHRECPQRTCKDMTLRPPRDYQRTPNPTNLRPPTHSFPSRCTVYAPNSQFRGTLFGAIHEIQLNTLKATKMWPRRKKKKNDATGAMT